MSDVVERGVGCRRRRAAPVLVLFVNAGGTIDPSGGTQSVVAAVGKPAGRLWELVRGGGAPEPVVKPWPVVCGRQTLLNDAEGMLLLAASTAESIEAKPAHAAGKGGGSTGIGAGTDTGAGAGGGGISKDIVRTSLDRGAEESTRGRSTGRAAGTCSSGTHTPSSVRHHELEPRFERFVAPPEQAGCGERSRVKELRCSTTAVLMLPRRVFVFASARSHVRIGMAGFAAPGKRCASWIPLIRQQSR